VETVKEIPAYVCPHVFAKLKPVLYVCRADGDWQLLCGGDHDAGELPRVVGLNHFLDEDPSLLALLDLPPDWEAERKSVKSPWRRVKIK
jgi:hypothetical protein